MNDKNYFTKKLEYQETLMQTGSVLLSAKMVGESVANFRKIVGKEFEKEAFEFLKAKVETKFIAQALDGDTRASKELLMAWMPEKYDPQIRKLLFEESLKTRGVNLTLPNIICEVIEKK